MRETAEQRAARFAANDAYCAEQIAKCEAEWKAKGYDKIMSLDQAEELAMKVFGEFLDAEI